MANLATSSAVSEVSSDGFTTTAFPVVSAGARLRAIVEMGKFQGTMMPMTPSGSRMEKSTCWSSRGMLSPWILSATPA